MTGNGLVEGLARVVTGKVEVLAPTVLVQVSGSVVVALIEYGRHGGRCQRKVKKKSDVGSDICTYRSRHWCTR